ncbi:MAG: peptidylprolyl isomerase [Pseudomonadota bacterium]
MPAKLAAAQPQVRVTTSEGVFVLTLDGKRAPATVANFLGYVQSGHYDGTIFHRVIANFMVQGGGFSSDLQRKEALGQPVPNEAYNGLRNARGTVAMARTSDPHSATAQFFINVVDNGFLNHKNKTRRGWGYAVFGSVTEGMDVVDRIRSIPTAPSGFFQNLPTRTVVVEKAEIIEPEGG